MIVSMFANPGVMDQWELLVSRDFFSLGGADQISVASVPYPSPNSSQWRELPSQRQWYLTVDEASINVLTCLAF